MNELNFVNFINFVGIFFRLSRDIKSSLYLYKYFLTDLDYHFFQVLIWWDLKVQWSWSLSNSSAGVVVGTVAWAEVASSADTKIGDWDATKMCADTEADKVFLVLASFGIGLLISKGGNVDGVHVVDLFLGSVPNKQRLASPFHSNRLTFRNIRQFNFSTSHSQNILGGSHISDVLVSVTGNTGTNGGTQSNWVHVTQGSLSGSEIVLILDIFATTGWLSVS